MTRTVTYAVWSTALLVLALAAVFLVGRVGPGSRVIRAVGAIDSPGVSKVVVQSPVDAYRYWKQGGFKGRTVLFVAQRWERLDQNDTQMDPPMSRPYPLKVYKIADYLDKNRLNERNFLFVAAGNDIVRRIVAMLPQPEYQEMREAALHSKNGRVSEAEVYQTHQGFPRFYVTADTFRGEKEPVLLYVSASYFKEAEPEFLFRQLAAAKLATDSVVLCRGGADPSVTPRELERLSQFARLLRMPAGDVAAAGAVGKAAASGAP